MNNRVLSALLCISLLFSFASVAGAKSSNVKNVYVDTVKEQQEETEQENTEPQQSAEEETAEKDIDTEAPKEYVSSLDAAINMANATHFAHPGDIYRNTRKNGIIIALSIVNLFGKFIPLSLLSNHIH